MRPHRSARFWIAAFALATACSATPIAAPSSEADDQPPGESAEPTTTTADPDRVTIDEAVAASPLLRGELSMDVVAIHPHDTGAFTQGLEVTDDGRLLESTGNYGESDRRIVDIETGTVEQSTALSPDLFGEGITIVGDELIQLTWREGTYLRADLDSLAETGRGSYEGEGWGLCHDGQQLVMSDGTATLAFRAPSTFTLVGSVEVTANGAPVTNLNELECVNGQVLANVWQTDTIVVIDPTTGEVVAWLDASPLRPDTVAADDTSLVLNGIAHDPSTGHFFLTGKRWPVLYEVELS